MTKPLISIIVLNYGTPADTLVCIESINRLKNPNYRLSVILIDNGSPDESAKIFKQKLPSSILQIALPKNVGFAGGNNPGIKLALKNQSDYVLLLNPDTKIIDDQMITKMLACNSDLTGPMVAYPKDEKTTSYDLGGKVDWIFARNTHNETLDPKAIGDFQPEYLSGVCLLIKSSVFKKIGFLDDQYFLYYEDADFCLRAKKAGYSLMFCPKAQVWHQLSLSANKLGRFKLRILAKSQLRFAKTHLPSYAFPFYTIYYLYLLFKSL